MSRHSTREPVVAVGGRGRGAIAAGSVATAEAGAAVLAAGGNAVDAVIAATVAASVSELCLTSLGGGGFLHVRRPDGTSDIRDFFVNTPGLGRTPSELRPHFIPLDVIYPGSIQTFHVGRGSVAVPGVLAGVLECHRELGRLPIDEVVAPAQRLAREGTVLEPVQAEVVELVRELLQLTPESGELIEDDGGSICAGDLVHNQRLADFLDLVADGAVTGLGSSAFADPLLAQMADDGLITRQDLDSYRVINRQPTEVNRGGFLIRTNPPPSFGGSIITEVLRAAPALGPAQSWATLGAVLQRQTALQRARDVAAGGSEVIRGTTHVSAVDSDGLVAGLTSSNGACSGIVVPGTGIQLNNMLGEDDLNPGGFHSLPPGIRMGSMMSPSIIECPDGSVVALGTGGSERIRSALAVVAARMADLGEPLDVAVEGSRLHPTDGHTHAEPGFDESVYAALDAVGEVNRWERTNLFFGGVHAVQRWADGRVMAVGDGRRGGHAIVV